jgi:methylmalonyl-CoA mutase, N-terminal domain
MAALEQAARDGSNLMPPIVEAAEAYATVGEISDRLRGVFGEYRES